MSNTRAPEHLHHEDFTDPMFLKSHFDPSTASLVELETYLAELGLVQRALASHVELMAAGPDADDAETLLRTLKHHRGVFAIALDQDFWHEEGERTHWTADKRYETPNETSN